MMPFGDRSAESFEFFFFFCFGEGNVREFVRFKMRSEVVGWSDLFVVKNVIKDECVGWKRGG